MNIIITPKYLEQDFYSCFSVKVEKYGQFRKRLLVFSNVDYPIEQRITTRETDILCFLNFCQSAEYYRNDRVEKILAWHRTEHPDFGTKLPYAENHYVVSEIPADFIAELEKNYDWNYSPRVGRRKCLTTGYLVVQWMQRQFQDREIILVNFGMDIKPSTRRSTDHNWQYEDKILRQFSHIYTQSARSDRKRKIYIRPLHWVGDNLIMTAAVENIVRTGMFEVNVDPGNLKVIWEKSPLLNRKITRANADYTVRLHNRDRWRADCRHIIEGVTAEFAGFIGEKIPVICRKPQIWMDLPPERVIEEKYVIISTGWQSSAETKKWSQTYWQQLVDSLPEIKFVQTGQTKNHAVPLQGVVNMIDRTDLPQLAQLVRDAACVISPPSAVINLAGAFDVPHISLSGGREPAGLTTYPCGIPLSIIGQLSCCRRGGCRNNHFSGPDRCCTRPITIDGDTVPTAQCMTMITPEMVKDALIKIIEGEKK